MGAIFENFHGIKLVSGPHTHPGSGPAKNHEFEWLQFSKVLDLLAGGDRKPVMLEVGAFWGLWSLAFRQRYPQGQNILVEYGSHQLNVGKTNFRLNGYDAEFIHGGVFLNSSGTAHRADQDVRYLKDKTEGLPGSELDLDIFFSGRYRIDLIHADIQGSEKDFINYLLAGNLLEKINNQILVVCTHSAANHHEIKRRLQGSYSLIQEEYTYGYLGHFAFRSLRLFGRKNRDAIFNLIVTQQLISFFERVFRISGQTVGVGKDGWLVFMRN